MSGGGARNGRHRQLHLPRAFRCTLFLRSGSIPYTGNPDTGSACRRGAPHLYDQIRAVTAQIHHHYRQGAGRQHWHALDAGQPQAWHAATDDWSGGAFHQRSKHIRQIPVPVGRLGHHPDDVDDHLHVGRRARFGHRFHQLRQTSV